jgi:hypothetical protein
MAGVRYRLQCSKISWARWRSFFLDIHFITTSSIYSDIGGGDRDVFLTYILEKKETIKFGLAARIYNEPRLERKKTNENVTLDITTKSR